MCQAHSGVPWWVEKKPEPLHPQKQQHNNGKLNGKSTMIEE